MWAELRVEPDDKARHWPLPVECIQTIRNNRANVNEIKFRKSTMNEYNTQISKNVKHERNYSHWNYAITRI